MSLKNTQVNDTINVIESDLKEVDPQELIDSGVLQEINRQILHPLGMALAVRVQVGTGEVIRVAVADLRKFAAGAKFKEVDQDKARKFNDLWMSRIEARKKAFGYIIQA